MYAQNSPKELQREKLPSKRMRIRILQSNAHYWFQEYETT